MVEAIFSQQPDAKQRGSLQPRLSGVIRHYAAVWRILSAMARIRV